MTKLTRNGTEPLLDYMNVSDVYADGIGRIDNNGATSQLIWFQRQHDSHQGTTELSPNLGDGRDQAAAA